MTRPSIRTNADGSFVVPKEEGEWTVYNNAGRVTGVLRVTENPDARNEGDRWKSTFTRAETPSNATDE